MRFVILSGAEFTEPTVVEGSFIMNDQAHIEAAITRSRQGGDFHFNFLVWVYSNRLSCLVHGFALALSAKPELGRH